MSNIDDETKEPIEKERELMYTLQVERRQYSDIPTEFLREHLARAKSNERAYERQVASSAGDKKPAKNQVLLQRIEDINAELKKRNSLP